MKNSRKICLSLIIFSVICGTALFACGNRKEEIVWYLDDPGFYGVEGEVKPCQVLESERFEKFNQRLEELEIPAEVTFKYMPDYEATQEDYESGNLYKKSTDFLAEKIKNLVKKDPEADIVLFNPVEYEAFEVLNPYLEQEENKKVKEVLPKQLWELGEKKGKTYYIPSGSIPISTRQYGFYKPFLHEKEITLNEKEIQKKSPKEVIEYLLPYFEEEKLWNDQSYLVSAAELIFDEGLWEDFIPVIGKSKNINLVLRLEDRKVVSALDTQEYQEALYLRQWVYDNNIDAHEETGKEQKIPVLEVAGLFQTPDIPVREDELWIYIPENEVYERETWGNGVLVESKQKDLAVQVLAASVYDPELSNLMIHGIEGKDYQLQDGHAVSLLKREGDIWGTTSQIGNNLIAYPNQAETLDKKERSEASIEKLSIDPYTSFSPIWEEEIWEKMVEIAAIYHEIETEVGYMEIPDLEAYLEEKRQSLKEAGVEEVLQDLQQQADAWEE